MRSYVTLEGDGAVAGWPKGTNRFYEYRDSTCDEAVAAFQAKVLALYQSGKTADILSFTTPAIPGPSSGYAWQARNCSVVVPTTTTNPVTGITAKEVNSQTIFKVAASDGTLTEVNIRANGGGAEWGESERWFSTTNGTLTFPFPFLGGIYHATGRKTGVTDATKYVGTDYTKTELSLVVAPVVPVPIDAGPVQDLFVTKIAASDPQILTVTKNALNPQTGLYTINVTVPPEPSSYGTPSRVWRYLFGEWLTRTQVLAMQLEPKVPYLIVAALVDPNTDISQWRNPPAIVTQTIFILD